MPTNWKARLRTAFFVVGVITTIGAALYGGYLILKVLTGEEDDRPPIIISNGGSILFEAQDIKGRGEFKVDGFDVVHDHSGKDTLRILVTVGGTGYLCRQSGTTVTPIDVEVQDIGILYSTGVKDEMIRVRASGKKFRVDPRGNAFLIDAANKYQLWFHKDDNDWKLKLATLDLPNGGNNINCEFQNNQHPRITIRQKWTP